MLQETHIIKESDLTLLIKEKFDYSLHTSNSAGVIMIVSSDYEIISMYKDNVGRQLFMLVEHDKEKILLVNIYSPNCHKQAINFMEPVYLKILEILNENPDCYVILAGNFNSCMTSKDYINRAKLLPEI
jgi:exonuclease III